MANNLAKFFLEIISNMERSLKLKQGLEDLLTPYKVTKKVSEENEADISSELFKAII